MFYYTAFLELHTERLFESGPIPRSKIAEWADEAGLIEDQFDEFILIQLGVDAEYRSYMRDKAAKASKRDDRANGKIHGRKAR